MRVKALFQFYSLKAKLLACFLGLGLLPLAAAGILAYERSRSELLDSRGQFLQQQAVQTIDKIDRTLANCYRDVRAFAFKKAQSSPDELADVANSYMQTYGYYDLIVIADTSGKIVAANTITHDGKPVRTDFLLGRSVRGEEWFENCVTGRMAPVAGYHGDLQEDKWVAEVYGNRGLALNFSAPVIDEKGQVVRVWSNRVSWERTVGQIMAALRDSMKELGDKAETQVLSKQGVILDDYDPKAVLSLNLAQAGLQAAKLATEGKTGFITEMHKRRKVLQLNGHASSNGLPGFKGSGWGVLVREDADEAWQAAESLRNFMLLIGAASALGLGGVGAWIASGIVRPLKQTSQSLASSSVQLASISQQMGANAEETSAQAGVVSAASEQVSKNVQTVATAIEEMTASIKEIARNACDAARVASQAVVLAQQTNTTVSKLGESSNEIGKVIKVITSIAEQTNLLALNATIEAARAGEAGKGFAVVANEVKELAKETSQATDEISGKIEAIQTDTKGAIQVIQGISDIINQISEISTTIAGAVEEQTVTTNEISRNVAEAAEGSSEITQNVKSVAEAAQSTSEAASNTEQAATDLSRLASALQELVARYRYQRSDQDQRAFSSPIRKSTTSAQTPSSNGGLSGKLHIRSSQQTQVEREAAALASDSRRG